MQPKFIHDLVVLCNDCQKIDKSFANLNEYCYVLSQHATNTRYPGPTELNEMDMKQAIDLAEKVLAFVKEKTV